MLEQGPWIWGNRCSFVYVLICYISLIPNIYLNPFVFLFNLFSLLKISFLASLKVKISFCACCARPSSLALGVCRLHPIPENSSRLLKTVGIGREKGKEIPKCFLCVRSVLSQLLFFMFHFSSWDSEARIRPSSLASESVLLTNNAFC